MKMPIDCQKPPSFIMIHRSNSASTVPIDDDAPPDRCGYILRAFESGATHLRRIRADVQQPMVASDMATYRTPSHRIEGAALDLSAG